MENSLEIREGPANWARRSSSPMYVDHRTLLFCLAQSLGLISVLFVAWDGGGGVKRRPSLVAINVQVFAKRRMKPTMASDDRITRPMMLPTKA